ncbi:MAG: penicillin-binding transpeptidase domain-containing protein [Pseudomonadota bacterium]
MVAMRAAHRQWRRARNLRAGAPAGRSPVRWLVLGALLAAAAGGAVIATHARQLGQAGLDAAQAGLPYSVDALVGVIPGAAFVVPSAPSVTLAAHGDAAIVVAAGMQAGAPVHIDLCSQMLERSRPRLLPVRIGYQFADVARLVAASHSAGRALTLRNVALAGSTAPMPQLLVSGLATPGFGPLQASWSGQARWASDAGPGAFRRQAWLVWDGAALRLERRASNACPGAGELLVQLYRKGKDTGRALVTAFPARGPAISAWLAPGRYTVPQAARASLEDQSLFQDLSAHGLIRLAQNGLIELAPRDLAVWQSAPDAARAGQLQGWGAVARDPVTLALFKRLYRMADGEYVREQVRIFNNERRLLAWRVRPALVPRAWQASMGEAPLATRSELPLAAARLFSAVPTGWGPWSRVAAWPQAGARGARIGVDVARGAERIELMLIGTMLQVHGARLVGQPRDACSGRACPSAGAVQLIVLEALPGARRISIDCAPLEMAALAGVGEERYRHLSVADGRVAWRPLAANSGGSGAPAPAGVNLVDRNGTLLWSAGAPSAEAVKAGLAPLLGLRSDHANSVAGMLARLPAPSGAPHSARLSLDLALQQASQGALDCIGMRRGRWDGAHCAGGQDPPAARQAGIVILDTENGDVLAAAGAGSGRVDAANWNEVRDFDRANPAASPLRLPALQHDGGAYRSPGSTFKIVSALGLELAAQTDPQVNALLAGMPLAAINRMARAKGFAFQTDAASYPVDTGLAHITNYKDQHLDRRARDGRLGLSEALTYSLNTWFAWCGELSDRSLFGRAEGGAPDLQALEAGALDNVRPIAAMAHRLGFGQPLRLDGGLLPPDFAWSRWDALQASEAHIDPIHTRHELRQMAIGLRMQVTPLHMALVAGAVGQGRTVAPRLLLALDGNAAQQPAGEQLGVRLDRIRAGMKGVVDAGTAASAFRGARLDLVRRGLSGKTGTAPAIVTGADGARRELATVWFTGWLEAGSVPGQKHRLAVAAFVSHSEGSGGDHAAPIVAAVLGYPTGVRPLLFEKQKLSAD